MKRIKKNYIVVIISDYINLDKYINNCPIIKIIL